MRGFHHTPANQTVAGAVDVETAVTSGEQDILNPIGINSIVPSVGRGAVLWGSRTLSSDPAWRYIHRRRLVTFVLRNIRVGTQWAIFERKDDPALPRRVANHIRNFLYVLWRAGALRGRRRRTPSGWPSTTTPSTPTPGCCTSTATSPWNATSRSTSGWPTSATPEQAYAPARARP